jgi:hypothetical protein
MDTRSIEVKVHLILDKIDTIEKKLDQLESQLEANRVIRETAKLCKCSGE